MSATVLRPSDSQRIPGLDGLRAISILLVLMGHGWHSLPVLHEPSTLGIFLANSHLGVMTFFVISGYLITHLLRREWENRGTISIPAFYARRAFRIFPALYAYLLFLTIIRVGGWIATTPGDLATAAAFLINYKFVLDVATNVDYWFVAHFWTLSLEEQFYLFWPATVLAVGLGRARGVAVFIVLAAPIVRVITYFAWPESRGYLSMMLHTAADPIMIGCAAALYQGHPSFEAALRRIASPIWPLCAALFVLLLSPILSAQFAGRYLMTVGMSANAFAIVLFLTWVIRHPTSQVVRVLSTPVIRRVGVLSYSLYLWQQLFLTERPMPWTLGFPLNFVLCFVAAEVSYRFLEQPFLRIRESLRRGRAVSAVPRGQDTSALSERG